MIRVFPRLTNMTPRDDLSFIGYPPLIRPEAEVVHISVTFTWDLPLALDLAYAWSQYYPKVEIGGPAYRPGCLDFTPGVYVRRGVTFTSRGCNDNCPWCLVRQYEGKLWEIRNFAPGYIVNDNNLLHFTSLGCSSCASLNSGHFISQPSFTSKN